MAPELVQFYRTSGTREEDDLDFGKLLGALRWLGDGCKKIFGRSQIQLDNFIL